MRGRGNGGEAEVLSEKTSKLNRCEGAAKDEGETERRKG